MQWPYRVLRGRAVFLGKKRCYKDVIKVNFFSSVFFHLKYPTTFDQYFPY